MAMFSVKLYPGKKPLEFIKKLKFTFETFSYSKIRAAPCCWSQLR